MSKKQPTRRYFRHKPILKKLSTRGAFTLSEARKIGLSHPVILQLVKKEEIVRLQRGLYAVSGSEEVGVEADYFYAHQKFGARSVIAGLSALSYYKLVDEVPTKIWLLVSPSVRTTHKKYRLLRTKRSLTLEIVLHKKFRITSLERSLIDALIFSSKIGERTSLLAVIRALKRQLTTSEKLFEVAKKLHALPYLDRRWESIRAGLTQ